MRTPTRPKLIYALLDPRTAPPQVCYVGCTGQTSKARLRAHIDEARYTDNQSLKVIWIKTLILDNQEPLALDLETVPVGKDWAEREQFWIDHFASPYLTNEADGGPGTPGVKLSAQRVEALKLLHTGRKRLPETGQKIRTSKVGFKHSEETKQKISRTKTGHTFTSLETRAKISAATVGKSKSEETKRKISQAKLDPEYSRRNREMLMGLVWITDGTKNARVPKDSALPDGWRLGRTVSDKHRAAYEKMRKPST